MEKADPFMFASQYQQEPDDALLEGVIYRPELNKAIADGRVCKLPIEPVLQVNTYWDLGINDDMSFWLVQFFRKEIRLIGFYSNNNQGMEHYINWLHDFRDLHGIRFGKHYGPHDLAVREIMNGKSRMDTAKEMGITFTKVDRPTTKRDSIEALRQVFPHLYFDADRCTLNETKGDDGVGYPSVRKYRREFDPDREVFRDKPEHDKHSNPLDALQQLGLTYKPPKDKSGKPPPRKGGWMGS